jgi:hypothetical protein
MRQLPSATALLLLASAVVQAQPSAAPDLQNRRNELRQALQEQRQANMHVGPLPSEPPVAEAISPERRLSLQERQELRRQLQPVRHSGPEPMPPGKP